MSYGDGDDPKYVVSQYSRKELSSYYYFDGDEKCCDICGNVFDTNAELAYHKRLLHSVMADSAKRQWDCGQLDLQNGVNLLWTEFMQEHDLPKVIFFYDSSIVTGPKNKDDHIVPLFYDSLFEDSITGEVYPGVVFTKRWLSLDCEAKVAALGHMAAHVEVWYHGLYDIAFNGDHTKMWRKTAKSYGLFVRNTPQTGYDIVTLTHDFIVRHIRPIRMIRRYHPIIRHNSFRSFRCAL